MKKIISLFFVFSVLPSHADENLLGYVKGAEPLPKGHWEFYQIVTSRDDKGQGSYHSIDTETEAEYGVTNRFNVAASLHMQNLNTNGLVVNGYLPQDKSFELKPVGWELYAKYNILSTAMDPVGFSILWSLHNAWVDPHSGQAKDLVSFENTFIVQKYFMEGQLITTANFGIEATRARRHKIDGLDPAVEWNTNAEMEIETTTGLGVAYRFMPNWFVGAEGQYQVEYETDVDRERFSLFAGPSIHFGGERWWATATYFPQISGGGEKYTDQTDELHLIEKTKTEARLKVGMNF